jgi:thiol-disulfide isomerase/thioredoxin
VTGPVILGAALVATVVVALLMRWKNGRFAAAVEDDTSERLTAEQIGVPLGERATLVQFSSAFCSPCRATRVVLADIASSTPGVVTVDIDAESHLQLVRDLSVMRTPTVLVLDAGGTVTTRASGLPRREQVLAAVERAAPGRQ